MPTDAARLFALFMFVTGLRFGEATEIRVSDLVFDYGDSGPKLFVQRRAVDVGASRNAGERFLVLPATKSGDSRIIDLPVPMVGSLKRHIDQYGRTSDDLLFSLGIMDVPEDSEAPRLGERWNKGNREFQHGTLAFFEPGRCRCGPCAAANRNRRRAMKVRAGRLRRNPRETDPSDHLPGDVWRRMWRGAIKQAGLDWIPRTHDLRHATASYLLDSTDPVYLLYDVMQILGDKSIKTTEQYLHRVSSKAAPKVFNDLFEEQD